MTELVNLADVPLKASPRCRLCRTSLWWSHSAGGWCHVDNVVSVDPVALALDDNPEQRRWVHVALHDEATVHLWVLEGTPPRAYVVAYHPGSECAPYHDVVAVARFGSSLEPVHAWASALVPSEDCPLGSESPLQESDTVA
jgi:hypothetical protein